MAHMITDLKCLNMRLNIHSVFVEMVAIEGADSVQLWDVFDTVWVWTVGQKISISQNM